MGMTCALPHFGATNCCRKSPDEGAILVHESFLCIFRDEFQVVSACNSNLVNSFCLVSVFPSFPQVQKMPKYGPQ